MENFDFQPQLIARQDGTAEASFVDTREVDVLAVAVLDLAEDEDTGDLSEGLDDQDSGHDGEVGEVAGEVRLVGGDVLDAGDVVVADVEDTIDEQEGVAMGQQGADREDVKFCHLE